MCQKPNSQDSGNNVDPCWTADETKSLRKWNLSSSSPGGSFSLAPDGGDVRLLLLPGTRPGDSPVNQRRLQEAAGSRTVKNWIWAGCQGQKAFRVVDIKQRSQVGSDQSSREQGWYTAIDREPYNKALQSWKLEHWLNCRLGLNKYCRQRQNQAVDLPEGMT